MGPGEKVDFGAEVFAQAHRFIYFTEKKILGADYGMSLIVPIVAKDIEIKVADLHIDSDQSNIGFGDKQSGAAHLGGANRSREAYRRSVHRAGHGGYGTQGEGATDDRGQR